MNSDRAAPRPTATTPSPGQSMPSTSPQTSNIPAGSPDEGRQLGLLLEAAQNMLDEEFRRTERLESKSRTAFSASGALFAVVMATTAGVLNALLSHDKVDSWVYVVLGGAAMVSIVALVFALISSLRVQKLHPTEALDPKTIEDYVPHAEKGNVAVVKHLIETYAKLLRGRRAKNFQRATDLKTATRLCVVSALFSLVQLAAVFVALITIKG